MYKRQIFTVSAGDIEKTKMRADAGKAAGVGRLLERLGISWAETAAFGDGENDAELLEAAGFAVAMEGGAQSPVSYTHLNSLLIFNSNFVFSQKVPH